MLREYREWTDCRQAAESFYFERIWDGPQDALGKIEDGLDCMPDYRTDGKPALKYGRWYENEFKYGRIVTTTRGTCRAAIGRRNY